MQSFFNNYKIKKLTELRITFYDEVYQADIF